LRSLRDISCLLMILFSHPATLPSLSFSLSGWLIHSWPHYINRLASSRSNIFALNSMSTSAGASTPISIGASLPKTATLLEGSKDYGAPVKHTVESLTAGKKVVLFAVPGAFTPGCSKSHVPSFCDADNMKALKEKGVDSIICTATNDPFVVVRGACYH
jgi:hypothetical protein